mgnify:CR=1 FL=1
MKFRRISRAACFRETSVIWRAQRALEKNPSSRARSALIEKIRHLARAARFRKKTVKFRRMSRAARFREKSVIWRAQRALEKNPSSRARSALIEKIRHLARAARFRKKSVKFRRSAYREKSVISRAQRALEKIREIPSHVARSAL